MTGRPFNHRASDRADQNEEDLLDPAASAHLARATFTARRSMPGDANGTHRSDPAVIALVRLLARQAAREALDASASSRIDGGEGE